MAVGRIKGNRVSGRQLVWGGQARDIMDRTAAALCLEIPESAVERIACGARRHRRLQRPPVEAGGELRSHGIDLCHDAIDAFAVARIRNALAATADIAVIKFRNDDDRFRFCCRG